MSIKTCEFVTPKHPDKQCDYIADCILDAFLTGDRHSKVAVEVMGGHKSISVSGEVRSHASVDVEKIVKKVVGKDYHVHLHMVRQSPFIAQGVDVGGAGDQGIMFGHALDETPNRMPYEYDLARNLCRQVYNRYPFDGKVQVTVDGKKVVAVVASFQNTKTERLYKLVKRIIRAGEYFINPAGEWTLGGFDADSGLSGRKLVVDSYGPEYQIGGGSFSGKDYTKVDRSGAYMARKVAINLLKKHKAEQVSVKLAYAIGKAYPVMAVALIDGREKDISAAYDLTPAGIRDLLKLDRPIYKKTAAWGHFGNNFPWDQ